MPTQGHPKGCPFSLCAEKSGPADTVNAHFKKGKGPARLAGLSALLDRKNMVVGGIEDPADQEDLIGIQVPLAHFDLGHSAPGDVAAVQLKLCSQSILCHTSGFSDFSNILADLVLDFLIHNITILHRYWSNYS